MKKIRVTISEDTWGLLKKDSEEFGINNNKLCNFILDKFKYNKKFELDKTLESQNKSVKKIIQFDLNVSNKNIYYDILKANKVEIEADFFRDLFDIYISKFKYQRELFIFSNKVNKILEAIKSKNKLKIIYLENIYTVNPYFLKREKQGDENFLFVFNETTQNYENFKLKELEILAILEEKIILNNKKYIEQVRENFDPFLGHGNIVKVKLTPVGESLLKSLTNYRPQFIKKEKDIFHFEISNENAKLYFASFMKEAEIIEPLELREEIKKSLHETLDLYK
ncbi:MAG: WYL domain-containing protein [Fusobacteriaceae bacterium]